MVCGLNGSHGLTVLVVVAEVGRKDLGLVQIQVLNTVDGHVLVTKSYQAYAMTNLVQVTFCLIIIRRIF